jgi:hypothetical protein
MKMLSEIVLMTIMTAVGAVSDTTKHDAYIDSIVTPPKYSLMTEEKDTFSYNPFEKDNTLVFNTSAPIDSLDSITNLDSTNNFHSNDFISNVYKDYSEHKEIVDNWIKIMTLPEGKRVIIDKWTIETLDVIDNTKRSRRNYSNKGYKKSDLKSAAGRINNVKEGYQRFDKYRNIFSEAMETRGLPPELQYLPMPESHVSPVKSKVGAGGYWQIMKGTKGDLIINNKVDERNSVVLSTEREADKLRGLHALFKQYMLDATCYIRGEYGVANDLENMLNLEREGKFFNSYKGIVYFHANEDHKIMSQEDFWKKTKRMLNSKLGIFSNDTWKQNYKNRNSKDAPTGLYELYLEDVKGEDSSYVKSFWEYYNLELNPKDVYWQYHEYLKKTKNNFDTPQYVPRLIASIILHNSDFEYNRQEPLDIVEIEPIRSEIKQNYADKEFRQLNSHIKSNDLKNGRIPSNTKVYGIVEPAN